MGKVVINGITYKGKNISVSNGVVTVDGITVDDKSSKIEIIVTGDIQKLVSDSSITLYGNAGSVDAGNSVEVDGNVLGNVDAGNTVHCKDVYGDVDAGNNVYCASRKG